MTTDGLDDAARLAQHLQRLRFGAFSGTMRIRTDHGEIVIEACDAVPINTAIEHVLQRLVMRNQRRTVHASMMPVF